MSNGHIHSAATIGIAIGIASGYGMAYFVDPENVPIVIAGCLVGLVLSNDADVDGGYIGHYYMRKLLGYPGEWYFNNVITPYQIAFKHRSFLSHFPIISTVFRLLYITFPFIIILLANQKTNGFALFFRCIIASLLLMPLWTILYFLSPGWGIFFYLFLGLVVSDTAHWLFDLF